MKMLLSVLLFALDVVMTIGRYFKQKIMAAYAFVALSLMFVTGNALAALPASVTTDLAAAKSDIIEVGAIVIGLAVAVAAIFWVKRPIR